MLNIFRETGGRIVAGVILVLIAVSFVFFGIDFNLSGTTYAARVNGTEIPMRAFQRELQATQSQYQQIYQQDLTEELVTQLRRSVIERMVQREAIRQRIERLGYRASDAQLRDSIRSIEQFQVGGEFSMDVYQAMLRNSGRSVAGFEATQREQLALEDLQQGIAMSSFVTPAEMRRRIELANERRDIAYARFAVDGFTDEVEITDADVQSHYDANAARYTSEETVDFNYVELSLDAIASEIEITEDELRQYYNENRGEFETTEERNASHILIEYADGERAAAEAEVEEIMSQLEEGAAFDELAAEYSDDTGTASQGGDLGWLARGTLSDAFEEALYGIEEVGSVTGPVDTDFGLHVIRLDDVREGRVEPFESVRGELREELSTRRAEDRFFDRANRLADLAFDAFDELESVASELGSEVQSVEDFARSGSGGPFGENRSAVAQAAFDEENLSSRANSDLIELSESRVLVLRVTEHNEPTQLPLDEVEGRIREELTRERASELASEAADAYAEAVEGGAEPEAAAAEHGAEWNAPGFVERGTNELPSRLVSVAFSLPRPSEGPVRERVSFSSGDVAIVFVNAVEPGDPEDMSTTEREQLRMQLINQHAQAEFNGYTSTVRQNATIEIADQALDPQL